MRHRPPCLPGTWRTPGWPPRRPSWRRKHRRKLSRKEVRDGAAKRGLGSAGRNRKIGRCGIAGDVGFVRGVDRDRAADVGGLASQIGGVQSPGAIGAQFEDKRRPSCRPRERPGARPAWFGTPRPPHPLRKSRPAHLPPRRRELPRTCSQTRTGNPWQPERCARRTRWRPPDMRRTWHPETGPRR